MRLLLDKNVHGALRLPLTSAGHDVTAVGDDYPPRLGDHEILAIGLAERRIIIANDLDFGELVIRAELPHAGVVMLRPFSSIFGTSDRALVVRAWVTC